ncbi:unnamed protein product [Heligmosomoides polygyrus]|uniref:DUF3467 domain-containing protein n=1 Tax=Heligmosomoides polygyrus TaxID=6339 RepID=A0A183G0U1_HELPZ|nr:unnamed protein product [Heligmosomoides polygyrus]
MEARAKEELVRSVKNLETTETSVRQYLRVEDDSADLVVELATEGFLGKFNAFTISIRFQLTAYQRLFFGLALTLRSEKFDHLMNRTKRTASIVGKQAVAASHYFDELKQMW